MDERLSTSPYSHHIKSRLFGTQLEFFRRTIGTGAKAARVIASPDERWRVQLYFRRRAYARQGFGKLGKGEVELRALRELALASPEAHALYVRKLWRAGRLSEALEYTDWLAGEDANSPPAILLSCARVYQQYGPVAKADAALLRAKTLKPDWREIYEFEARNQKKRGNVHVAIEAAERAYRLSDSELDASFWGTFVAQEHFRLNHFEQAVQWFKQCLRDDADWETLYQFALSLERTGNVSEAEAIYRRSEALAVPKARKEYRRSELHFKADNHAEMLSSLDGTPETHEKARLAARAKLFLGKFSELADDIAPERGSAMLSEYRALSLELAGREAEALESYRRVIKLPLASSRRELIAHRLARVAHKLGDSRTAVEAELQRTGYRHDLNGLDDEVSPQFAEQALRAQKALKFGQSEESVKMLSLLSRSASSRANLEKVYSLLGQALANPSTMAEASLAFFWMNPFRLPHSGESNSTVRPLTDSELYSEALDTLPLLDDVVLYESYAGMKTSCNPLAICQELMSREDLRHLHHVWVLRDGAPIHQSLRGKSNVHFVRYESLGYRLHLATAGTLICNSTFPRWFVRRDGQRYLNTWHGVPWKHMGRDINEDGFAYDNVARNFLQATDLVFPGTHAAKILLERHDVSKIITATVYEDIGSPRLNLTFGISGGQYGAICRRVGVDPDRKKVLYAPTWRGTIGAIESEMSDVIEAVERLSTIDAEIMLRVHYFVGKRLKAAGLPSNVRIVSDAIDTNELLGITDLLVSDYSSIIFDFAPLNRPIVKYVYDLSEYTRSRGLYFSPEDVPGINCGDLDELYDRVNQSLHLSHHVGHSESATYPAWKYEDGRAAQRVADLLFEGGSRARREVRDDLGGNILIAMNGMNPNGITRSLRNLMAILPQEAGHVQVVLPRGALKTNEAVSLTEEIRQRADITLNMGSRLGTRQERIAWGCLMSASLNFPQELLPMIESRMQRERRLYFGEARFDAVIDFDGHAVNPAAMVGLGFPDSTRSAYVVHNEFCREMELKFPRHRSTGALLNSFDIIASVSPDVMSANRDGMHELFGTAVDLHRVLPNTINPSKIISDSLEPLDDDLENWFQLPGPHLVMVGRLSREKNHVAGLEALKIAHENGSQTRLLILGDGPLRSFLFEECERLGIGDFVFFAGLRPNPYPSIARSNGLLLSSTHEGQPMVFLEAMTLGIPIAATDIPASISVLRSGERGMIVPQTVEGVADGILALSSGEVAPAVFDAEAYKRESAEAFLDIVRSPLEVPEIGER